MARASELWLDDERQGKVPFHTKNKFTPMGAGVHFSKVPLTFRARNQIFNSKSEE